MSRSPLTVLTIVFALAHLPFIVSTLEDIDSVNFALGVRDFDVAQHQPHPPGYPVYIALAKVGVALTGALSSGPASTVEARALSALSLIGALAAIVLGYRTLATLSHPHPQVTQIARDEHDKPKAAPPWRGMDVTALAASALMATCPLFWYLAVRPMSDMPGLAIALAAQACCGFAWWLQRPVAPNDRRLSPEITAASGRAIVLGALLAGLATGLRTQNALLTLPLLFGVLVDRIGRGVAAAMIGSAAALTVGLLVWVVPLLATNGGLDAYLTALGSQAGEDFAGVEMLYSNPTNTRLAGFALERTLVQPWDSTMLGSVMLALAGAGVVALVIHDRRSLVALGLVALPYFGFHLLFHDTNYVRYALPLVPVIAFLAVRGAELMARRWSLIAVGVVGLWGVVIAAPVLAAYGSEPSPVSRAVLAMNSARATSPAPGALGLHQTFRRPLQAEDLEVGSQLPSPPRREWLELVKYWRQGHVEPLWFLADPQRSDLALVDPRSRQDRVDYAWHFQSLSNIGGMRPSAVQWYRMPAPGWFAGEGWALSPETAGIARVMARGPSVAPITAWVRRRPDPVLVIVGGRHLGSASDAPTRFVMAIDGSEVARWEAPPGFFLHVFDLPVESLRGEGLAELTIRSGSDANPAVATAIEQFDLQATGTLMWGYDEGWQEAEFNTEVGTWRWTSDRATLRILGSHTPLTVTLRVERPRKYFGVDPIVRLTASGEVLGETNFADRETWSVNVPAAALLRADGRLTLETNQTFVPAESGGAPDLRRLGLRVFDVTLSPQVSP